MGTIGPAVDFDHPHFMGAEIGKPHHHGAALDAGLRDAELVLAGDVPLHVRQGERIERGGGGAVAFGEEGGDAGGVLVGEPYPSAEDRGDLTSGCGGFRFG